MDFEKLKEGTPYIILVVFAFLMQYNLFVTPKDLTESEHRLLTQIEAKYATKQDTDFLREQFSDMKTKIDKIYDKMIGGAK